MPGIELDLASQLNQLTMLAQVVLAFVLGGFLGLQREYSGKAAGLRTYTLVTVGAAVFTLASVGGFNEFLALDASRYDPSRIAANIVVGIGFFGAGVIVFRGAHIEGLTTAAGVWTAAAIGMAVGLKLYLLAIFTTLLVFFTLEVLGKSGFEKWLYSRYRPRKSPYEQ